MSHLFKEPKKYKKLLENYKVDKTSRIYKNTKTRHLVNALVILQFCQYKTMVNHSERLLHIMHKALRDDLYFLVIKETLGKQFTAGEDIQECSDLVEYLDQMSIQSIVNYMFEYIPGSLDPPATNAQASRSMSPSTTTSTIKSSRPSRCRQTPSSPCTTPSKSRG